MAWIDAVAEDLPSVGDDAVDVVIDDEMMATPDGSPPRRSAPDLGSETTAPANRARRRATENGTSWPPAWRTYSTPQPAAHPSRTFGM